MNNCSRCGAELLPSAERHTLCPACLLRLGLESPEGHEPLDIAAGFRVLAPIGRGPDATVYLAQPAHGPHRLVTLKLFDQPVDAPRCVALVRDLVTRIEACEAAPNLTILDAGIVEPSQLYVVSRYVPGMAIDAYFRSVARRHAEALSLLGRVCRLVSHLHGAGITHGAIKPPNVIVATAADGAEPMLLDTGLRAALESSRAGFTSSLTVPRRRAPDRRSDIAGLRRLAADLFASRRGTHGAPELIQALARREFETASELADETAALAAQASS